MLLLVVGDHLCAYGNVPGTNCRILVPFKESSSRKVDRMQNILEANRHKFLTDLKGKIIFKKPKTTSRFGA